MAGKQRKTATTAEFGDFQTPPALALAATRVLQRLRIRPSSVLEPTCGQGSFLAAAATCFPEAGALIGVEINPDHLAVAATAVVAEPHQSITLQRGDFFTVDWARIVTQRGAPWLIIGNPPWVTNAALSRLDGDNLPKKSNSHGRKGIEAITGKSNFDISEWMLLRYLEWLQVCSGTIAVLCKTSVARKVLRYAWQRGYPLSAARIYAIDALQHFGAAVDACFFVLEVQPSASVSYCEIYDNLDAKKPYSTLGFRNGHLISDVVTFDRWRTLFGLDDHYIWRSGIKHDCAKVMELLRTERGYRNGLGEVVCLEEALVYPVLKSSDIGNGRTEPRAVMLVPQQVVGQDTSSIRVIAPATWEYLCRHADLLRKRGSVIYRNKPQFSIFGVGPYSFAPWKVAISGFYKDLRFVKVGPCSNRPIVFDDTVNFLPCISEDEADFLQTLLSSPPANEFFRSMIHWQEKRPITVEILKRLHLGHLATALGYEQDYRRFTAQSGLITRTLPLPFL